MTREDILGFEGSYEPPTREAIERAARQGDEGQSLRERFLKTMRYETPDRLPHFEFGYRGETLEAWHEQGLPAEVDTTTTAYDYFGIESMIDCPVEMGLKPPLREHVTIEETDDYRIFTENVGVLCKVRKDGHKSIPQYLDFPLKEKPDWEWFREKLRPGGRFPENWDEVLAQLRESGRPVRIRIGSILGWLRNWMGFEDYAVATILRRDWIAEMMEDITVMVTSTLREAVERGLRPDVGGGWEDISFNSGPICDIRLFEEVAVPMYRRITDELRRGGCEFAYTDSDGDVRPLVPGFLRGGINCMFPAEVKGGSDPVLMRERFGTGLRIMGGVDKLALARGPKAIEKELLRLLPLVADGGYIPHCDHLCPPDVRLEDYKLYLRLKREMFGCGKLEPKY